MWCFFLIWQFLHGAEGWEFTVKGRCDIQRAAEGFILVDAANRRPVAGLDMEIRDGGLPRRVKTGPDGRVPAIGAGLLGLTHP
ncbi:MAG: hypothetical protein CVU59_12525, partial [Deltaproteobacteria bacterium HGW-Deltaproteobacteria-17]